MLAIAAEIAQLAERVRRSLVQVQCRGGGGSGIIWGRDGLLVTNAHVVQQRRASITLWNGAQLQARLCAYDASRDLAALRVDAENLPAVVAANAQNLRVGQVVFALGNPHGSEGALTAGVIHSIGPVRGRYEQTWVQAAVRLHPGNSGGPLFDTTGAVVGINSMIANGLALAVPVWAVSEFLAPAMPQPWLGIWCEPVQLGSRSLAGLALTSREGLLVVDVAGHSPAARAGLMLGDVISGVSLQGQSPLPANALERLLSNADPSSTLRLEIVRGGKQEFREVFVAHRSAQRIEAA